MEFRERPFRTRPVTGDAFGRGIFSKARAPGVLRPLPWGKPGDREGAGNGGVAEQGGSWPRIDIMGAGIAGLILSRRRR
jgi:hypothetical protein